MATEPATTRDPAGRDQCSRASVRTSFLLMMLISMSAQASIQASAQATRGFGEISLATRLALQHRLIAEHLLPAATATGLSCGIRFEMPTEPLLQAVEPTGVATVDAPWAPPASTLLEALLNLPPPIG